MAGILSAEAVQEVPVERLKLWPENPRKIAPARLEDLKRALVDDPEMLWARPLIALPDGTVIAGNQRLRAALALGWQTLPVVIVDLNPERARLWALKDNNFWGDWDEPALAELLSELSAGGLDLALTGFESRDIDRILEGLEQSGDPDDPPPLPIGPPESRAGELYRLGGHVLLCADTTEPENVARALSISGPPACLLTDPPWGVSYQGRTRDRLEIMNDSAEGQAAFLDSAFTAIDPSLPGGTPFYLFSPAGTAGTEYRRAIESCGWRLSQGLVWVKDSIVLGHSDYHYRHEDILYGHKPGAGRPGRGRHAGTRWWGGNDQGSTFFFDRPKRSADHPTSKPTGLISELLRNSTRSGEVVFDPFCGSGSTLIAAELLGRRCVAIELDPRYCDVIRKRYAEFVDGR